MKAQSTVMLKGWTETPAVSKDKFQSDEDTQITVMASARSQTAVQSLEKEQSL